MKNSYLLLSKMSGAALAAFVAGLLLSSTAQAQNYYFDPSGTVGQPGGYAGGSGSWSTSPFTNDQTGFDQLFPSGSPSGFVNGHGTVTVDAPETTSSIEINTNGAEIFSGANAITIPVTSGGNPSFNIDQTAPVTFNAPIDFDFQTGTVYAIYSGNNSSSLTLNAINFSGDATNFPTGFRIGGSSVTLNGAITNNLGTGSDTPSISFSGGGTMTLTSTASLSNVGLNADSSTILTKTANLGTQGIALSTGASFLTDGPGLTITNNIQDGGNFFTTFTVGSASADDSTFSGVFSSYVGSVINLTAAAGSTVHFVNPSLITNPTGTFYSTSDGTSGQINKVGPGAVSFETSVFNNGPTTIEPIDVKNGTLLLNNSSQPNLTGSILTIDNVPTASLSATQTYATLGGTGNTAAVPVVASGPNSSITPGDPSVDNGTGSLYLSGGLTATSGVTLNFKLDGANNSSLELGGSFTPGGTLTVNLARTSANLLLGQDYYLLFADMALNGTPGTDFNLAFNAPLYYKVSSYDYDTSNGFLSVEFELVPEPSTYALMFAGLGFLAFCVRRKAALLKKA